ncbi:hypothetical protein [Alkalihalobacillus sp. 1P02AB]|uniref:hypothetical protein n=1 Tax=Alkalihalobacillus sp. 1P02AB TaxID=3132260 RepID=UPI0039A4A801
MGFAKCKCGNDSFGMEDTKGVLQTKAVFCKGCNEIIGIVEDIDFKVWKNKMYSNHMFFENKINEIQNKAKKYRDENDEKMMYLIEKVESLHRLLK